MFYCHLNGSRWEDKTEGSKFSFLFTTILTGEESKTTSIGK